MDGVITKRQKARRKGRGQAEETPSDPIALKRVTIKTVYVHYSEQNISPPGEEFRRGMRNVYGESYSVSCGMHISGEDPKLWTQGMFFHTGRKVLWFQPDRLGISIGISRMNF